MKNIIYSILLLVCIVPCQNMLNAQATISATINPLTLPCGGGQVNLSALGNSTNPVFGDNFNTGGGGLAPGWTTNVTASFNNPCGPSVDGTPYLWMGSSAQAPRALTTPSVDVSCGGTVCFDYRNAIQGQSSPCEGMDQYDEGVGIQYSTDGGATFTTFGYIAPNGNVLATNPNSSSPYTSGNTSVTVWGNHCFTIPPAAYGTTTIFRIRQFNSTSASYDHWGIDNFYVYATPCAPYIYDWEQIPGSPDPQNTTANVTQTTTFTVHYTNGTDDAVTSVTVTVASISLDNVTVTAEACLGDNNASVTSSATTSGGTAPFTYALSGPVTGSNATGSFSGLSPGLYTMTLSDAAGCMDTYDFTVIAGLPCCSVTASGSDPSCNGGNDGTATATPANGQAPYSYLWSDGQTTQTASGLTAGNYSVTITDANGCTSSANTTLGEPNAITSSTTPTDVLCFGGNTGQILVNAPNGGTPGYTYSINGGNYQASSTFSNLTQGNYTISVKDINGCTITLNETVNEPLDLTLTETANTDAICGQANGTSTVSATGGTGTYTYDLGGTTNTTGAFTGLSAGNYSITVTDANLCTQTLSITIANSSGPTPFVDASTNVACAGGLNGSVTIGVNSGTAPYTYSLDGGTFQASNTFTLAAGSHTVTVSDFNSCTGDVTFNITEPAPLTFTTTSTDVLCFGDCNGTITATVTTPAGQQNPPYTYSSDNGTTFQSSNVLTGLCSNAIGTNVVVKDASGCLSNANVLVGTPTALTSTFTFVEPSCFGVCDGEIHLTPTAGGTTPYSYSIDNGSVFNALPDFTGLCAGDYNVLVEDANGCQVSMLSSTVTTPPQIQFNFIANNPSNCGSQDGSFEITAFNGTPNYQYSIDGGTNFQPSGLFTNLFSGLYTLVAQDANGCMDSTFSPLSDLQMTSQLDGTQDVTCYHGNDGIAQVSVTAGGVAPITYVLSTLATGYTSPPQGSGLFLNLLEGQHAITVTDGGSCINVIQLDIFEPDTITFTTSKTDLSCPTGNGAADGTLTISNPIGGNGVGGANNGGPYSYSIDGGASYQASPTFNGLTSGTYSVYVQDGNGCEGQSTITLNEPAPFNVVVNPTNLTCNGNNSGFIQVVGGGATPNYSYDLNGTTNTTGIFPSLAANPAYNITVTDGNSCVYTTTQTITEPALLTANYTITDANCNGVCDGQIDVTANGGVTAYLYSADNGTTFQSSNILTGLCAGNHQVQVKDANDCTVDATQTIIEPSLITFTMTSTPATCGNNNATVTINANNGTPTYQYSASSDNGLTFSALQNSNIITGLSATTYIIKVTDLNGCEVTQSINLAADPLPSIDLIQTTNPLCNGDNNGIIQITASGGVTPYQYSVDNGGLFQNSNIFNTLVDGSYTVVVEDFNGCQTSSTVSLTEPLALTINVTETDLLCNNDFTGEIVVTANNGTAPYQYSIDNGTTQQGSGTFSFIAAGNYSNIIVTDNNNCTIGGNITVNEPAPLAWDFNGFIINDPTCFGVCNGEVITQVVGGTQPYSYNWSSAIAGNTDTQTGTTVCSGTYSVIVTDNNNCQFDSLNFVLTDPAPVSISSIDITNVTCNGLSDGEILVNVPVQTPTISQFSINGGAFVASNNFTGLPAGNYDVTAQNTNGCQATYTTTISEPNVLIGDVPPTHNVCYGEDVLILPQIPTGGTPNYTYEWFDISGNSISNQETFNQIITTLTTFTLVVTDANGCTAGPYSYDVSPTPQLDVTASADVSICPGETATISAVATGGQMIDFGTVTDYSYSWSPATQNDTLNNLDVTPAATTTYTITVTDDCNAVVTDDVTVTIYDDPTPLIMGGGVGCEPYTANLFNPNGIVANGGTAVWTLGDGTTITDQDTINHLYTATGCYDVSLTVTTVEGCSGQIDVPDLVCIHPNPIANFYFTPAAPTTSDQNVEFINTSQDAETFSWNFGGIGTSSDENPFYQFNVDVKTSVDVCLIATSDMGCTDTICQVVTIFEELLFYVPNVFTPDGDDYNETFLPVFTSGFDPYDYHLIIFNRWGEVMFESYNADYGWDGHYAGKLMQDGVYIWQIEFGELITDERKIYRGHVTILK